MIAPYEGALAGENNNPSPQQTPQDNRLVIPGLSLNELILEGSSINVVNEGATWRRPQTSTPDNGGNTVIVGHRYFASRASTFYNLDKVSQGEKLAIYWEGKEYVYVVRSIGVVEPDQVEVEQQTDEPTLTLYTCYPLWTAKQRLVILATLVEDV